jgi:hypothetical protein
MDQATLVGPQLDDVPRLIAELKRDQFDVKAAFWLYTSESDQWYLYLVTDAVDREGPIGAYKAAYRTMRRLPDLRIDRFQVKLVAPDNPVAKAVMGFVSRRPGPLPTQVRGANLGDVYIEDAYIYKFP